MYHACYATKNVRLLFLSLPSSSPSVDSGAASKASAFSRGHSHFLDLYFTVHIYVSTYIYIYLYLACCATKHARLIFLPLPSLTPTTAGQPHRRVHFRSAIHVFHIYVYTYVHIYII